MRKPYKMIRMIDSLLMLLAVSLFCLLAVLAPVEVKVDEPTSDEEESAPEALPAAA